MAVFLIIVACIWFGLAAILVVALVSAARRPMPSPPSEPTAQYATVVSPTDSAEHLEIVPSKEAEPAPANAMAELVDDQAAR